MDKEDIHIDDLIRILFGEVPGVFYIELILRVVFIYLLLVVSMRLMGRRLATELSRIELVTKVSLAAAIGIPLQEPSRGLVPALIVAVVVVASERMITFWIFKNRWFEKITQDKVEALVVDAVMIVDAMKGIQVTRERLSAELRSHGIKQLGEIKRMYIEANGKFSLVKAEPALPGLCLIPYWDEEMRKEQSFSGEKRACKVCGKIRYSNESECANCHGRDWEFAVVPPIKNDKG